MFQSTLPARGSDVRPTDLCEQLWGFNPRSPRGGATVLTIDPTASLVFQSTLPARGSDIGFDTVVAQVKSFNPRSPRGGATRPPRQGSYLIVVSIHAPREGERPTTNPSAATPDVFQSTLPARGSDSIQVVFRCQPYSFNPRSPRGGAT